jgi:polar amino acid transport system substrate-binding protein
MNAVKIGLALAAAMLASAAPAAAQQEVLKVATNATASPIGGYDPQAKAFDGMAVEFLRLIAKEMKVGLEFVAVPAGEQLSALAGKKVDVIAGDFGPSADGPLAKTTASTYAYAIVRDVLLVKGGNKKEFKTPADFKGMNLGFVKGTAFGDELPKLGAKVKSYDSARDALAAVDAGAIDGAVMFGTVARAALNAAPQPNLEVVETYTPILSSPLAYVVDKSNDGLAQRINDPMQILMYENHGNRLAKKWGVTGEKSFYSPPCTCVP